MLAAGALAAAGCSGDDDGSGEARAGDRKPAGMPSDFNLQTYDCEAWNESSEPVRRYVLARLHEIGNDQVIGPDVEGRGSVLTDEQAIKMFENTCSNPRARGFVLYKIYAFSRGFRGGEPGRGPGS